MISNPTAKIADEEKEHLEWLSLLTYPFSRHPLRLSLGHRAHNLPMITGWSKVYISASDFDHRQCNIAVETWASNISKLNWGDLADEIRQDFHSTIQQDCPGFWSAEEFNWPATPVPNISKMLIQVSGGSTTPESAT
jgi:hypothetical protein